MKKGNASSWQMDEAKVRRVIAKARLAAEKWLRTWDLCDADGILVSSALSLMEKDILEKLRPSIKGGKAPHSDFSQFKSVLASRMNVLAESGFGKTQNSPDEAYENLCGDDSWYCNLPSICTGKFGDSIEFENFFCEPFDDCDGELGKWLGWHKSGWLGCYAGGDGDWPVAFALYAKDGSILAYIPRNGNFCQWKKGMPVPSPYAGDDDGVYDCGKMTAETEAAIF